MEIKKNDKNTAFYEKLLNNFIENNLNNRINNIFLTKNNTINIINKFISRYKSNLLKAHQQVHNNIHIKNKLLEKFKKYIIENINDINIIKKKHNNIIDITNLFFDKYNNSIKLTNTDKIYIFENIYTTTRYRISRKVMPQFGREGVN